MQFNAELIKRQKYGAVNHVVEVSHVVVVPFNLLPNQTIFILINIFLQFMVKEEWVFVEPKNVITELLFILRTENTVRSLPIQFRK